jgi:hypothetical protein
MKKVFVAILISLFTLVSYSQEFDPRLEKHFGKDKLLYWQKKLP